MNGEFKWGGFEGFREQVATSSVRTNDRIIYVYSIFFLQILYFSNGGGWDMGNILPYIFWKKAKISHPQVILNEVY